MLIDQICDDGETGQLEQLLTRLSTEEPENVGVKTSLARVMILRKNQLETAYRLAKEAFDRSLDDPVVLSTYAYSELVQGNAHDAARLLEGLKSQALQMPWVATCYGIIEAQSGTKEAARRSLDRAQTSKLLPEELELVRLARAASN